MTFDPSGNTCQKLSSSQAVTYSHLVTGFGSQLVNDGSSDAYDGMGAQWGYRRESGNLFLLGHRYYSSQRGQFLTRDPIGYGGGINLYGYTKNNPINRMDSDGTDDIDNTIVATLTGIGIVAGSVVGAGGGGVAGLGVGAIPGGVVGAGVGGAVGASAAVVAVGLRHAIMSMSAGSGGAGIEPGPNDEPDERPAYKVNQAHHYDPDKDPIPDDAEEVYGKSILDPNGRARWGKGSNGNYYRYQGDHTGWHFNGEFTPKQARSGVRCMANTTWKGLNPR